MGVVKLTYGESEDNEASCNDSTFGEIDISSESSNHRSDNDDDNDGNEKKITNDDRSQSISEKSKPANDSINKGKLRILRREFIENLYAYINETDEYTTLTGVEKDSYAELDNDSMESVIDKMKEVQNFNSSSKFLDIGCGIGKPNYFAAHNPRVDLSYGVEIHDEIYKRAQGIFKKLYNFEGHIDDTDTIAQMLGKCHFHHLDIKTCDTLNPFTHIYMYDTA